MNKMKLLLWCMILCLSMGLVCGCAESITETKESTTATPVEKQQETTAEETKGYDDGSLSGLPSPFTFDSLAGLTGEEWADAAVKKNAAAKEKYTAHRFTTASGVTVQKVPNDERIYNVAVLNAEQRGCNSCHDLSTALEWLPLSHPQLANEYPSEELSPEMCFTCHSMMSFADVTLGDSMHALHMNSDYFTENMNGSCLSCHHIDIATGEYVLWDRVKYNVLTGITTISADTAPVEITYSQDVITPTEYLYGYWEDGEKYGITNVFTEDQEILNNWTIAVTGDAQATVNLKEFLDKHADCAVTEPRMIHCTVDGVGANQVGQVMVKGIPMSCFFEEIGYALPEGMICNFNTEGTDGMHISLTAQADTMFVYEINGETISAFHGFPVQIWHKGGSAGQFIKAPVAINVVTADPSQFIYNGFAFNGVNAGIFNYRDGQVFQMGDEIVFEGYANSVAPGSQIVKVEYSLDKGQTWVELDTTASDPERWIYWYCRITPQSVGSYVLTVRATDSYGVTMQIPIQSLFHVE